MKYSKRIIAFIVSLSLFMDALDATILNTAIPTMSRSLHVYAVDLKIALLSYLLTLAIFIPISGWVADKYGIKRVFIAALCIFTLSSFWCGHATTITELVVARAFQGVGGSFMMPLGRLILLRTFPRHEYVSAMNHVIMIVSVGLMLGPLAGGFITDHFSWHWIFWVNVPIGIFASTMAGYWLIYDSPRKVPPIDLLGFFYFGSGLAMLTFALSDLSESTANHFNALIVLTISVLLLLVYYFHSRKKAHPIINPSLFQLRTFKISVIGNICCRLGFAGTPFLLPLLLQICFGYTAQASGLLLVSVALGVMLAKSISLRILRTLGFKNTLLINTIMISLVLWTYQIINIHTTAYTIVILNFIFGLLIALQYSSMNSLAYADTSEHQHSSATSVISTIQQLSQSFGVAIAALLLHFYTTLTTSAPTLTIHAFHQTFFALGFFTLLSTVIFFNLKPNDGHQMICAKNPLEAEA